MEQQTADERGTLLYRNQLELLLLCHLLFIGIHFDVLAYSSEIHELGQ
jgi:hypothetical protein